VQRHINLDEAARVLAERIAERPDLTVGPFTWKGFDTPFDEPLATDRSAIEEAYSVGVRLWRGSEEGAIVLYAGGWADYEYWAGIAEADVVLDAPGWGNPLDVDRFAEVVARLLAEFAPLD